VGEQPRLDSARAGGEALGLLLEHFRAYLLLVANRELPEDVRAKVAASDLVQETMLRAVDAFAGFQGQSEDEVRAWLRRILLNYLANVVHQYRDTDKRDLTREVPLDHLIEEGSAAVPGKIESPSQAALVHERNAALQAALEQLPEHYRQVIAWRNYDRLAFAQIGQRLGCSEEAARKLWTRAVEKLAEHLEPSDEAQP
jgi:RNA polymerase sigma-70 factor (ECF subfamily)